MTKKIAVSIAAAMLASTAAMADMARVEAGAGVWSQKPSGNASYTDGGADGVFVSGEKEESDIYAWMLIKHPVPILPNLRLEYAQIKDSGIATGEFKDFDIGAANSVLTYDMKQYDIIPYYNILDNTAWTTIDLGLDIKVIDTSYTAAPSGAFTGYSDSQTIAIPLLYARGRVEIPATNIGLETDIKFIGTGKSKVYDARAKIDYTLSFIPVVQPAVEVGYRVQKIDIDIDDTDSAAVNIDYSGVYAGMMLRF